MAYAASAEAIYFSSYGDSNGKTDALISAIRHSIVVAP